MLIDREPDVAAPAGFLGRLHAGEMFGAQGAQRRLERFFSDHLVGVLIEFAARGDRHGDAPAMWCGKRQLIERRELVLGAVGQGGGVEIVRLAVLQCFACPIEICILGMLAALAALNPERNRFEPGGRQFAAAGHDIAPVIEQGEQAGRLGGAGQQILLVHDMPGVRGFSQEQALRAAIHRIYEVDARRKIRVGIGGRHGR